MILRRAAQRLSLAPSSSSASAPLHSGPVRTRALRTSTPSTCSSRAPADVRRSAAHVTARRGEASTSAPSLSLLHAHHRELTPRAARMWTTPSRAYSDQAGGKPEPKVLDSEATTTSASGPSKKRTAREAWNQTPTRWYAIPTLLGALVLLGVQARRQYVAEREGKGKGSGGKIVDENGQVVKMEGPWTVFVIGALPLNSISRLWGWANNLTLPVWFRPYGFKLYSWIFGCTLDEMKDPDLTHYRSLGEFFYRELKEGARPIAPNADLVSPADGKVLHFGFVSQRRVEQVKGITYSLDALLGLSTDPEHREAEAAAEAALGRKLTKKEQRMLVKDEKNFARVNGIDYSLDRLLGGGKAMPRWRIFSAAWWSHWVVDSVGAMTPYGADSTARVGWASKRGLEKGKSQISQETTLPNNPDGIAEEAGISTPDTPEILGRYANVAMDLGSQALPPILQAHSPGHDGVKEGNKLFFCVVYLAPGDYHRFHSPTSWIVERRRHFRGELYSVSPYMAQRLSNLFVLNERVALLGRWRHGFFGMVPVGATNVGSIRINFDSALRTNVRDQRSLAGTYSEATYGAASRILGGQPLQTGEEMGGFLLGSTIVLVFEAPETFEFEVEPGQKVKVGEKLGELREPPKPKLPFYKRLNLYPFTM